MNKKVLILGASGMLGNTLFKYLSTRKYDVYGTVRDLNSNDLFSEVLRNKLMLFNYPGAIENIFSDINPDYVINCIGIIKQRSKETSTLEQILINSVLPHYLEKVCKVYNAKLIQISTDCVFLGDKGMYTETDTPDAIDLYGRTKWLGEVISPNAVTLRTSIIGRELYGRYSLIDWFLSQDKSVNGFKSAIFSGFPTIELARIIDEFVIPNSALQGIYHVSSNPISKYDLLKLVASEYGKEIEIIEDGSMKIDRSLDSSKFKAATGFTSKPWPDLVHSMHRFG